MKNANSDRRWMLAVLTALALASPLEAGMGAAIARAGDRLTRFLFSDRISPTAVLPLQLTAGRPPVAPTSLRIVGRTGTQVELAWESPPAGPDRTVVQFELRRSGRTIARPTETSATVTCNPTGRETESFTVAAVDDLGRVSAESAPVVTVRGVPVPMTLERRTAIAWISGFSDAPDAGGEWVRTMSDSEMNTAAEAALAEASTHLAELEWGQAYGPNAEAFLFGPMGFALASRLYDGAEGEHAEQVLSQSDYRLRIGGAPSGPAGLGLFGGWPVGPDAEVPDGATVPVRWAEVLDRFDGEPEVLAVRESELMVTADGAVGPVFFVPEPGRAGMVQVKLLPALGGLLARTTTGEIAAGSVAGVLEPGQWAGLDLLDPVGTDYLAPWQTWPMAVTVDGPAGVVKIIAVDPQVERLQGWEAALAEGIELPSGTPLVAEPMADGRSLSGRRLVVVALQPGEVRLLVGAAGVPETNVGRVITVLPGIQLAVDANRDGVVTLQAESSSDAVTAGEPFRFWVNDDADTGDLNDADIPLGAAAAANFQDDMVNSDRDLVDFFPVFLDLAGALEVLRDGPPVRVRLKQADGALNFAYSAMERIGAEAHWRQVTRTGYGDGFDREPGAAETHRITAEGVELSPAFLTGVRDHGWGVLLLEGRSPTLQPLELELERSGEVMATTRLPLRLSNVEDMFFQVDLTQVPREFDGSAPTLPEAAPPERKADTNGAWPDELTDGNYFVFVHGFNVDAQGARGWQAEMFKRVHVLGSRARFVGITWHGATGLHVGGGYLDYHKAVFHALQTGDALARALEFTAGKQVTIAAHSLGNAVVSQAIEFGDFRPAHYLMFNAALPIEAFTPTNVGEAEMKDMAELQWAGYNPRLYASRWFELFPDGDPRSRLTWQGRFADVAERTDLHHFFSTGEDVMDNNVGTRSASVAALFLRQGFDVTLGSWKLQELVKGVGAYRSLGSILLDRGQAGWSFSTQWMVSPSGGRVYGVGPRLRTPGETTEITADSLRNQPFFGRFLEAALTPGDSAEAADAAKNHLVVYDLLARAIPSKSYAAGANPLNAAKIKVFDMQLDGITDGGLLPIGHTKWNHSDLKALPLPLIVPVYNELISRGTLQ